jgi:peroxiredoxin
MLMKKMLLLFTLMCLFSLVRAQLPNGSIAPDFTATDINGQSHNLYSLLNQGYTVYLDVSATWCGPCILEYPDFIVLQRMFGARDFEFVSLSADKPDQEAKALKFLQEKFSAVPNYLFSEEDKYALIEAVDPNWNGALPYTILVEPGGKVVWSHQGEVDFYALKRDIVEHPKIGRYF